ncbi:MAG: aminodeoxychorismate/anthranilate synthase component II [Phycisphaerales bacterium]|nr:aminodeoxychorismate/anthranilate synthase component II [Planctomycetota bacterium]MBL6997737.1 aminodeoxychorismate/anthranilate synthase component II [Phycisphaerales bacterium]
MLLIIDNYDSFTFNLVQRIGEHDIDAGISREMNVVRNDQITLEEAVAMQPSQLVISPGPCRPEQSGVSQELIAHFKGKIPILGVCLGHQAIAILHGMKVIEYSKPVHGKTSEVFHDNTGIFEGLPNPFHATRYHSLVVDPETVSEDFTMNAWTQEGVCMGVRWSGDGASLQGVQFHPESFLTSDGPQLLSNFLAQ